MADSKISVLIRDPEHPCAPYERTRHSFRVDIFNCDFTPLHWKGVTYQGVPLNVKGKKGGFIHGQFDVPPGCYIVRAYGRCKNVVTEMAMIGVGCDETACVSLLPTTVRYCLVRTVVGVLGGTVDPPAGEESVRKIFPKEADAVVRAINALVEKLPKDNIPSPPTIEQLEEETQEQ
jgi:hypothetical protein